MPLAAGTGLDPGDLDDIRRRIEQTKGEIARVSSIPVPSDDLIERIGRYVADLAAKARPVIQGIGEGQALRVQWPLLDRGDRAVSGHAEAEGNALLLAALIDSERLAERLLATVADSSISQTERDARLNALQLEMTQLRYDEEASVCAAISAGEDVSRAGSALPWAVLGVEIEHALEAAA